MQITTCIFTALICAMALTGCVTPSAGPDEPVPDGADKMEFLEEGLHAEKYLFPEYLLLADFELKQHGHVSQTSLIGVDMQTRLNLGVVHRRLSDIITAKGWMIDQAEVRGQSFRLMAFSGVETLEIRAVQGAGPTQILILYQPDSAVGAE